MTTSVNYHRIASDCYSGNACNVGRGLRSCRADTNGVGFAGNTGIADVDIEIACGEAVTREYAHCNIVVAACVTTKRKSTVGCVLGAGCVVLKRSGPRGCVVVGGRVAAKRANARGSVLPASCVIVKRDVTGGY